MIIGALSIAFGTPWFNTMPIVRFILMMIILWGATAIQVIGIRKIGRIAEWLFILGIALPVILLIISFFVTFVPAQGTAAGLRGIYVWTLIGMCAIVSILPLVLYHWHEKWQKQ